MLTQNVTFIGLHQPLPIGLLFNTRHRCKAMDLGPQISRTFSQRLSQICRLYIAVLRVLYSPNQTLGIAQWPDLFHLFRCEEFNIHSHSFSNTSVKLILIHAVFTVCQSDVTHLTETDTLTSLFFQLLVKINRVLMQLTHRVTHIKQG